jgi:hypothetical protein
VLLHAHSFMFSVLFTGIVGSDEVRPKDMLGSGFSGTHSRESHVIRVLWDVTQLMCVSWQTGVRV